MYSMSSHTHLYIVFLVRTNGSDDYRREAWCKLKKSIEAIHNSQAISYSLEELYLAVENSCSHGFAPSLYLNLQKECHQHMIVHLPEFNQLVSVIILIVIHINRGNLDEGAYLVIVDKVWESFCNQMVTV